MMRYILAILVSLVCLPAKSQDVAATSPDFSSPESTFEVLVKAIRTKDMELYKQCWDPARLEKEGLVERLLEKPETWEYLQGYAVGDVKLLDGEKFYNQVRRKMWQYSVYAPHAPQKLETVTMVRNGKRWQMYSW